MAETTATFELLSEAKAVFISLHTGILLLAACYHEIESHLHWCGGMMMATL